MKTYIAKFAYQKNNGFSKEFEANNDKHAYQLAKEYERTENKGEPKSEMIRLLKVNAK